MASHLSVATHRWRAISRLVGRTPLRVRLIVAVLALVTVALTVISVAGIEFLRGYLLNQADQQLRVELFNTNIPGVIEGYLTFGQSQQAANGISIQWLPESGPVRPVWIDYTGLRRGQPVPVPEPAVQHGDNWLNKGLDHPVTVSSVTGNERWRGVSVSTSITPLSCLGPYKGTIIVGVNITSVY